MSVAGPAAPPAARRVGSGLFSLGRRGREEAAAARAGAQGKAAVAAAAPQGRQAGPSSAAAPSHQQPHHNQQHHPQQSRGRPPHLPSSSASGRSRGAGGASGNSSSSSGSPPPRRSSTGGAASGHGGTAVAAAAPSGARPHHHQQQQRGSRTSSERQVAVVLPPSPFLTAKVAAVGAGGAGGGSSAVAPATGAPPPPVVAVAVPAAAAQAASSPTAPLTPPQAPSSSTLLRSMLSAAAASTPEWRSRTAARAGPFSPAPAPVAAPSSSSSRLLALPVTTPAPLLSLLLSLLPLKGWLRAAGSAMAVAALALLAAASSRDPVAAAAVVAAALVAAAGALQASDDHDEALRARRRRRQQEQHHRQQQGHQVQGQQQQQRHQQGPHRQQQQNQQQQKQQPATAAAPSPALPHSSAAMATARVSVVLSGEYAGVKAAVAAAPAPLALPLDDDYSAAATGLSRPNSAGLLLSPGGGPAADAPRAPCPSPVLGNAPVSGKSGCPPAYSQSLGTGPDALARAALLALPEGELPQWLGSTGGVIGSACNTPRNGGAPLSSASNPEPSWLTDDIKRRYLVCKPSVRAAEDAARAAHATRARMAVDGGRPAWLAGAAGASAAPLPPSLLRLPRYAGLLSRELQIHALDATADGHHNVVVVYKIASLHAAATALRREMCSDAANNAQPEPSYDDVADALAEHLWAWMEWLWSTAVPAKLPGGRMLQVIDCAGGRLAMVGDKAAQCAMRAFASVAACYPERLQRCLLVNPPSWASAPLRVANALMDERTRGKMSLLGAGVSDPKVKGALAAALGGEQKVPREYGGTCSLALGEYPLHRQWIAHLEGLGM